MNYTQEQIDAFILEAKDRVTTIERERCAILVEQHGCVDKGHCCHARRDQCKLEMAKAIRGR